MQYFLSIDALATGIIALIFGVVVLIKNGKSIINQTLFFLTLTTSIWSLSYWQWLSEYESKEVALFWLGLLSVGSTMIPVFYFHWVVSLLSLNKKNKILIRLSYFVATFFLLFSFSDYFVKDVQPFEGYFAFWPKAGLLYSLYLGIVYFGLVVYSLFLLFKHHYGSKGLKRSQIKYVIMGSLLGFGGGATNFFLWYDIPILPLGTVLVILYPILFSYSIIKHRLMDIKFVMRRYSVYIISLLMIIVPAVLLKYFASSYYDDYNYYFDLFILFLATLIFPVFKDKTYHFANKYFFSSLYDSRQVIAGISSKLRSTLNIHHIYNIIYETLNDAMHVKSFGVLRYDEEKGVYTTKFNMNFNIGRRVDFEKNEWIEREFVEKNMPFIVSEAKHLEKKTEVKETFELLKNLKVEILLPLIVKDRVIGLIALGPKESGDMFNDEDLQVLSIIASQSAIAIENATLYEETKQFGQRMEEEVKKATKDLRAANERLKKLDAAKSEFISIASHQLRTPLTVIKGYISMMLEGSFGKIPGKMDESLEKVYVSNERLISLVENLLNISRIESGRLKFSYKTIQLEDMVESVCEELDSKAKEKNLKLEFKRLKNDLPKVTLDTEKVRQVVMNLIDNAVKYTPKGKVTVTLRKKDDKLLFCVADKGMGISAADLPNLFKKFSRGSGAKLEHTEGTGLGLFVARQMIEAHHGRVWAESPGEGKGSKFCFEIPYDKEEKKIKKTKN